MRRSRLAKGALTVVAGGLMAGLVGGLALGAFATGGHKSSDYQPLLFAEQVGNPDAAHGDASVQGVIYSAYDIGSGPPMEEIVCKGCGPGIAERNMAHYAYGYDDREVQAWLNYIPMPSMTAETLEAEVATRRATISAAIETRAPDVPDPAQLATPPTIQRPGPADWPTTGIDEQSG